MNHWYCLSCGVGMRSRTVSARWRDYCREERDTALNDRDKWIEKMQAMGEARLAAEEKLRLLEAAARDWFEWREADPNYLSAEDRREMEASKARLGRALNDLQPTEWRQA